MSEVLSSVDQLSPRESSLDHGVKIDLDVFLAKFAHLVVFLFEQLFVWLKALEIRTSP